MAKKNEFRMDSERSAGLGRLLPTKKQRESLLRWTLYGLVCLVGSLLQDVVLCQMHIKGATTDIVPCLILMIAVLQDADSGSVFALIASCLYYFSGSAPGPYSIPLITGVSIFAVIFRQAYLRQGFFAVLLCAALGMGIYEMSIYGIGLFLGHTTVARAQVLAMTAVLTLAVVPVAYPVLRATQKIGGEPWKE